MKALLILSIIGIIFCSFFFIDFWNSTAYLHDDYISGLIQFLLLYIFVIPHAIVTLVQSIKRKKLGLIIMTGIGFVLYFGGLFTSINGYFTYWNRGMVLGYETAIVWYVLSFLFFLSLVIVDIVLSVKFLINKKKQNRE